MLQRLDPLPDRVRIGAETGEGRLAVGSESPSSSAFAVELLVEVGQRVDAEAVPCEAVDAVRNQRPADRRGNRNEQLQVVHLARRFGQQRAALGGDRARSRAASSSGSASGSQIGATSQRNWRRNQAGEVDGATASTSLRSAGSPRPRRAAAGCRARPSRPPAVEQALRARAHRARRCGSTGRSSRPNKRSAVGEQRRPALGDRNCHPWRRDRVGNAFQPRLRAGSRGRPGQARRAPRSTRRDRWPAPAAFSIRGRRAGRLCAPAPARTIRRPGRTAARCGAASPGAHRAARQRCRQDQVDLAGGEVAHGYAVRPRRSSWTSSRRPSSPSGPGTLRRSRRKSAGGRLGDLERSAALALADQRELGLGEQLQQIGPRRLQADLEHAIGHRDDLVDRAQRVLERIVAVGGDLAAAGPARPGGR